MTLLGKIVCRCLLTVDFLLRAGAQIISICGPSYSLAVGINCLKVILHMHLSTWFHLGLSYPWAKQQTIHQTRMVDVVFIGEVTVSPLEILLGLKSASLTDKTPLAFYIMDFSINFIQHFISPASGDCHSSELHHCNCLLEWGSVLRWNQSSHPLPCAVYAVVLYRM